MARYGLGEIDAALDDLDKSCGLGWNSGCNKARWVRESGIAAMREKQP
jgi:hypothetical protein